jgi:transcriptional regulator with XRE-family HTH domain
MGTGACLRLLAGALVLRPVVWTRGGLNQQVARITKGRAAAIVLGVRRQTLEEVLDDLGGRLAELRRERGWTQQQTADRVGMLARDCQAIENGKRAITIRSALTLAHAFDLPLRHLFDPPSVRVPRRAGRPAAVAAAEVATVRRVEGRPASTPRAKKAPPRSHRRSPPR